jgi:nitrite reductase (NADH) large subunit
MMCFLGVNLSGAIAAGMTVSEARSLSPAVRKWRARWVWYHTLLFWPLPIFLAFHILAVYYF